MCVDFITPEFLAPKNSSDSRGNYGGGPWELGSFSPSFLPSKEKCQKIFNRPRGADHDFHQFCGRRSTVNGNNYYTAMNTLNVFRVCLANLRVGGECLHSPFVVSFCITLEESFIIFFTSSKQSQRRTAFIRLATRKLQAASFIRPGKIRSRSTTTGRMSRKNSRRSRSCHRRLCCG